MPFTFAHPLAVLPFLNKRYFSATGLVMGSIAPDFEHFLKMRSDSVHSHTLAGLFYFDVPMSCLLALFFHQVLKESLLSNSPSFLQTRLVEVRQFNFLHFFKQHYWIFLYSALFGSSTHLVWDSFTHSGGFMANQIPVIMSTRIHFQGVNYPLWYSLQNISSLVGISCLVLYVLSLRPKQVPTTKPSLRFWLIVLMVTSLAFYLRYVFGHRMSEGNMVVALISAFLLGLFTATWQLKWQQLRILK